REILRIGCITKEQIEQTVKGEVKLLKQEVKAQYKPSYRLILVTGNKKAEKIKELCNNYGKDGKKYVILDIDGALTDIMQNAVTFNGDTKRLAASLYSTLLFYEGKTDILIASGTEDKGVGGVITDRLERAAEEIIET
ncbi:MAG: hypothetical protein IJR47_02765, partial [Clostridia bacterium]|nr:hypothetical protein [Clostridia bacterium]